MPRRVAVTGVGLVSSLGIGTEANWQALLAGRSGIRTITAFDASNYASRIAGEVPDFDPLQFLSKKDVRKMDIFIQYAIAASEFALQDAGLPTNGGLGTEVGVFIASGIGGFSTIEREHKALLREARARFRRSSSPRRSSTWRRGRSPSGSGPRVRTRRPARRARHPHTPSATLSR